MQKNLEAPTADQRETSPFNLWPAVWYSMEKLAGDFLFGLTFVKLSILPMLSIPFVYGFFGEFKGLNC